MRRNKKCLIIHLLFFGTALFYVVIYPGFYSYLEEKRPHIYKLKLNLVLLKNVRKFDYKTINAPYFALLFSSRPCI